MQNIRDMDPSKIRARKMGWMFEETWNFAVCFIDIRRSAMPRTGLVSLIVWFATHGMSFGCQYNDNYTNGPND